MLVRHAAAPFYGMVIPRPCLALGLGFDHGYSWCGLTGLFSDKFRSRFTLTIHKSFYLNGLTGFNLTPMGGFAPLINSLFDAKKNRSNSNEGSVNGLIRSNSGSGSREFCAAQAAVLLVFFRGKKADDSCCDDTESSEGFQSGNSGSEVGG